MNSSIFIPKKIKVGYQNRSDTYTKSLAYVIYYDEKNKLRKEQSWKTWRDKSIEPSDYENTPTEGFVLNKKVGDYTSDWNHRKAYIRVYDPRGFEFEISVENLLYILENSNSFKGKGLEGEFVYGYDKSDLILIPVSSPDYESLQELNKSRFDKNYIKSKDLKLGATYLTRTNKELVYLGRYDFYDYEKTDYDEVCYGCVYDDPIKRYWFANKSKYGIEIDSFVSISGKLIKVIEESCAKNYSELYQQLKSNTNFSKIDPNKTEYTLFSKDQIKEKMDRRHWIDDFISFENKMFYKADCFAGYYNIYDKRHYNIPLKAHLSKQEAIDYLFDKLKVGPAKLYLTNGEFYRERGN